jgi:hypothetical protein
MHSTYARISNVSAFMSSCLMTLLVVVALSSFMFTADPKGDLLVSSVKVLVVFPGCVLLWASSGLGFYLSINDANVFVINMLCIFAEVIALLTPVFLLFASFVGHDRRYPRRKQQYAFVNFNVSAGTSFIDACLVRIVY